MRVLKIAMQLCTLLIILLLTGCNSLPAKNQLPASKPKDFNFIFNYGVGAKNQLDTINGEFTKDMVFEPSITTDLRLTEEEMNLIYTEMKRIKILDYPENYNPKNNVY